MSFAIAAAGTGGHVFPALAVAEALVEDGVGQADIHFVGGGRLEAQVVPVAGFPLHQIEVRGLERSFTARNLTLPLQVGRNVAHLRRLFRDHGVEVVLGVGGYVTPPAVIAGRLAGARVFVSEQNAEAGLGNRAVGRLCTEVFGSFPHTVGLPTATWVGNPVRANIARFDRPVVRPGAIAAYRLDPELPTIGLLGGSLGAGALNQAFADVVETWNGPPVQYLQLAGDRFVAEVSGRAAASGKPWQVVGFESAMERFYAACDVIVSRAGGAVAELAATSTPSVLVPGVFGSGRHQLENARVFVEHGAAIMLPEDRLAELGPLLNSLVSDRGRLAALAEGARRLAKPQAASFIAHRLRSAHG